MTLRAMQWTLFAVMAATVPLPFVAFMAGGVVPLVVVLVVLGTNPAGWGLGAIHLAVLFPILYFAARLIARRIARRPEEQHRRLLLGVVGGLLLLGLLPLYGMSHGTIRFGSAYRIYWEELGLRHAVRAPGDVVDGLSLPYFVRTLRVCTWLQPSPGHDPIRSNAYRWFKDPGSATDGRDGIRWGIEPPPRDKKELDEAARREIERMTAPPSSLAGRLAGSIRGALDGLHRKEPWQYGEYTENALTRRCVVAQVR